MSETVEAESKRWPAFVVAIAVAIATILDLVKVNVTISPIATTLDATTSQTQLIVAGYVLAFGIMLVPAGRLGDIWSRKALFLIGLVVYAGASLYCSLAPDATHLVIARFAQGLAAGILMPQVIGLIQTLFQREERGQAFGIFGAAVGLGTAFGPTIGGAFIGWLGDDLGWRWTFGMNVPIALLIAPFAVWLIPGRQRRQVGVDLDLPGVALLAATVLCVMLPFVLTSGRETDNPARWWLLVPAALLATAFISWERRFIAAGRTPVIDFELFRQPSYRHGVLITTCYFAMMPPMFFVMTLYNQQGLGHAAVVVGMITIPFALTSALAAALTGRHAYRHGASLVLIGVSIFCAVLVAVVVVAINASPAATPVWLAIVLAVGGVGQGMVLSSNQTRTVKDVPLESAGVGASFMQVGQRLGNAMGIAIASSIFFSNLAALPMPNGVPDPASPLTIPTYLRAFLAAMVYSSAMALLALAVAAIDLRSDLLDRRSPAVSG